MSIKQQPTGATKVAQRSVLVLVDNTDESHSMWTWAQQNAIQTGDRVTLVAVAHVETSLLELAQGSAVEATYGGGNGRVDAMERQEMTAAWKEARELLQAFVREAQPQGWTLDTDIVTAKNISDGEALVNFLKTQKRVDEVFVASKRRGQFKKAMMTLVGNGPVSDYVQRHAPCRVEVVQNVETDARASLLTGV